LYFKALEYEETIMETSKFKEQLRNELSQDFEGLLDQVAQSVLQAKAGRVIVDSEELVRDAAAEFRRQVYQKALELRMRTERSAFSPSEGRGRGNGLAEQRPSDGHVSDDQWPGGH
jgi:hypothetical protein